MATIIQHDQMLDPKDESYPYPMRDTFYGSVASINDDPFFRNYLNPQSAALSKKLHTTSHISHNLGDNVDKDGYPANTAEDPATSQVGLNIINIAVMGAAGVGKSTLIQRALGLDHPPHTATSNTKMAVDNVVYTINLTELDVGSFDITPNRNVKWPKQINGQIIPRMDGALILYDVMNSDSIVGLPQMLNAFAFSALPTVLVSCKCDNPVKTRKVHSDTITGECLAPVERVKAASTVPESARHCLGSILNSILRTENTSPLQDIVFANNGSLDSTLSGSSFADTDDDFDLNSLSFLRGFPSPSTAGSKSPTGSMRHLRKIPIPAASTSAPPSSRPVFKRNMFGSSTASRQSGEQVDESGMTTPNTTNMGKELDSIFTIDEFDADSSRQYTHDVPILPSTEDFTPDNSELPGIYFEDLVQRLLRQPMLEGGIDFSDTFLCLYRKFAAPAELLWIILREFDLLSENKSLHSNELTEDQQRVIRVLSKWVTTYPGDFAGARTRQRLDSFIKRSSPLTAATRDMQTVLNSSVIKDEDGGWARTDADLVSDHERGLPIPCPNAAEDILDNNKNGGENSSTVTAEQYEETALSGGRLPSVAMSTTSTTAISISSSKNTSYSSVEDYQAEAATILPTSTMPLNKFRYQICMDIADDKIAEEITRIDWVMFSSIQIRDLVRHVSLPLDQKEKAKSLAHVNRMISHFNHIAHWIANLILMKDKAKYRALILEKFMIVAMRLRKLNNYNGLAAVIAGINGLPVHRLTQTRALVPEDCQKRFIKLEQLMSPQNNHSAYRLAWENSSLPKIPFIPLHRRDLVSAEEGGRVWVGLNLINWKKFENMADVLLPIMRSQGTPYPKLERCNSVRELILDCRLLTEEEIHSRSLQLELSSSATSPDGSKKSSKFPWFSRSV